MSKRTSKARAAALKGWKTREANAFKREVAALKAAMTRRANIRHEKASIAAIKGWKTKRKQDGPNAGTIYAKKGWTTRKRHEQHDIDFGVGGTPEILESLDDLASLQEDLSELSDEELDEEDINSTASFTRSEK